MKKLCIVLALASASISADWVDDMVASVTENNGFIVDKATKIIKKYIEQDKSEIETIEKESQGTRRNGFWAALRGGTYQAQLIAAKASLKNHEAVEKFLKELPENKNDREELVRNCRELHELSKELVELQKQLEEAKAYSRKAHVGALIAAKAMHIQTKKTLMKTFKI